MTPKRAPSRTHHRSGHPQHGYRRWLLFADLAGIGLLICMGLAAVSASKLSQMNGLAMALIPVSLFLGLFMLTMRKRPTPLAIRRRHTLPSPEARASRPDIGRTRHRS